MDIEKLHENMQKTSIRCAMQLANVAGANEALNFSGCGFSDRESTIRAFDIIAGGILNEMEAMGCLGLAFDVIDRVKVSALENGVDNISN